MAKTEGKSKQVFSQLVPSQLVSSQLQKGYSLLQKGEYKQAQNVLRDVLKSSPNNANALYLIGACHLQLKDLKRAINFMAKAVKYAPENVDFINNLGAAYRSEKLFDKAFECLTKGLEIDNDSLACRVNLAWVLKDLKRHDEAANEMLSVVKQNPSNPGHHFSHGNLLFEIERYEQAIEAFEAALALKSNYKEAWLNLGNCYKLVGKFEDGLEAYDKALELDPTNHAIAINKGMMLLKLGQFEDGWAQYERRVTLIDFEDKHLKKINSPLWMGETLTGKTIVVFTEQGFGDTFQFCRYITWVKSLGAKVFLYGHQKIEGVLSRLEGIDEWIIRGCKVPKHDFRVSIMSLPGMYLKLKASYNFTTPYIKPNPELIAKWKSHFPETNQLKVGIVWQGNPGYIWDKFRSIKLEAYLPLILNEKVTLYSLQVDDPHNQLNKLIKKHPDVKDKIVDMGALIKKEGGTFDDTAGILAHLDLVVTADTSMSHLTGALGFKVFTLLPLASEWRWGIESDSINDYPSMTLFRQKKRNDWREVMLDLNNAIEAGW